MRSSGLAAMCQKTWHSSPRRSGEATIVSATTGAWAAVTTQVPQQELVAAEAQEERVELRQALGGQQHDERRRLLRLAQGPREALGVAVAILLQELAEVLGHRRPGVRKHAVAGDSVLDQLSGPGERH